MPFTVTQDLFFQEIALAVFDDLKTKLLKKERNHCIRVDYLPTEVMYFACEKINLDPDLQAKEVQGYVLTENRTKPFEVDSGRLIELRNRTTFGVLVIFIKQGFRGAAEDSYDIHTFESFDLAGVLIRHKDALIKTFTPDEQEMLKKILTPTSVAKLSVENHLRYLIALKNDGCTWETAGAYLHYLELIPDLQLKEKELYLRLERNRECVDELRNPDKTTFLAIENFVAKGLKPDENNLRSNLLQYFLNRNETQVDKWAREILDVDDWRGKLSFDKWKFKDIEGEDIEVFFDPLYNAATNKVAPGFDYRGDNLYAATATPVTLKWKTNPPQTEEIENFMIVLEREEAGDNEPEELLRKRVKGTKRQSKIKLNDLDLEEGVTILVKFRVYAKSKDGNNLAEAETEPFYIEGGDTIITVKEKIIGIRNRADAIFEDTFRTCENSFIESERWETGRTNLYKIKTNHNKIFKILINPILFEIERKNLTDPYNLGAWNVNLINQSFIEETHAKKFTISTPAPINNAYNQFLNTRRELFDLLSNKVDNAVIEILDLREFKAEIISYVRAYHSMFNELETRITNTTSDSEINNLLNISHNLMRMDSIYLEMGTTDSIERVVLLCPTHPMRLLWLLQYQQLLFDWSTKLEGMGEDEAYRAVDPESIKKISSLNIPSALSFENNEIYINTDNIDLYWSILPNSKTNDIRKVVTQLMRALGFKETAGEITSVTPLHIKDRIWRYLKHHPYVTTLKLNVINPGDGYLVLNTIRALQKDEEFKHLKYDITFYGNLGYELMGSAFDDLMNENTSAEGVMSDIDEELLQPNNNPLFPKMFFSKIKVNEDQWNTIQFKEAHISVLIDRFSTKTLTRQIGTTPGSFFLNNLMAEYRSDFHIEATAATWSRKVIPNQNLEIVVGDNAAELIFKTAKSLLGFSASYFNWNNSFDQVPTIQLELSEIDKRIITAIHENSDWVFTIDRNFGIEYFDNPANSDPSLKSYLIDYTPEFIDGIGHRLIVSTYWLKEIEKLIEDGLKKVDIPSSGYRAEEILNVIKSISGRLALKLINNPNNAKEIIGLALTRKYLEKGGKLKNAVLIPVDTHIDLYAENKRRNPNAEITVQRSDLILAEARDGKLHLNLIEVKFRSGAGTISELLNLKDQIANKNENTKNAILNKFLDSEDVPKIDKQLSNKTLSNLISFYFDRSIRHGLFDANNKGVMDEILKDIEANNFNISFEKSGYIYHWLGETKMMEDYQNNQIFEIGQNEIRELLDITQSEIELRKEDEDVKGAKDEDKIETITIVSEPPSPELKKPVSTIPIRAQKNIQEKIVNQNILPGEEINSREHQHWKIMLGIDCDRKREVHFDPYSDKPKKLANQHLLIVGKSGAGKSQTTCSVLIELNKLKIPFLILDFQGEYIADNLTDATNQTFLDVTGATVLDPSEGMNINPLEVPIDPFTKLKENFNKTVYRVASILDQIFALGDIQHPTLRAAIMQAFAQAGFRVGDKTTWGLQAPDFNDIWAVLQHMEKQDRGAVRNLKLRIQPIFENNIFNSGSTAMSFENVLSRNTIIRLSTLPTVELMKTVCRFTLQSIYNHMISAGPSKQIKLYVVLDEAHKISYDQTLTDLIREARKYGIGFILASQTPRDFDSVVFDNMGTKICLQLEGDDSKIITENFGLSDNNDKNTLKTLLISQQPMRGLIRNNHYEPFRQLDLIPFYKKQ
jgi:DNA phosphorothioation-dependent restriction protein DptH